MADSASPPRVRSPHVASNEPAAAMPFAVSASPPVDPAPSGPTFMTAEQAAERDSSRRQGGLGTAVELTPTPIAAAHSSFSPHTDTPSVSQQRLPPPHALPFTPISPSTLHLDHAGSVVQQPAAIAPPNWSSASTTPKRPPSAKRPPSHPSRTEAPAQSAILSPVPQPATGLTRGNVVITPPRHSASPLQQFQQVAAATPNGLHAAGIRTFMVSDPTQGVPSVAGARMVIDPLEVTVRDSGATQAEKDVGFAGSQALASAFGLSPPQPTKMLPQWQAPAPLALPDAVGTAASVASQPAFFSPASDVQPHYPAGHVSFNVAPSYNNGSMLSGAASQSNMAQMQKHMLLQQQKLRQQQQQPMVAEEQAPDLNTFEAILHSEVNPLSAYVETNSQIGDLTMFDGKPSPQMQPRPAGTHRTTSSIVESASPLTLHTAATGVAGPVHLSAEPQQLQPRTGARASGRSQPAVAHLYPHRAHPLARASSHAASDGADPSSPGRTNWMPQQFPGMHDLALQQSDNHGINEQMGPHGVVLPGAAGPTFDLESTDSHGIDGKSKRRGSHVPALPPQHPPHHVIHVAGVAPPDDDNSFLDDAPETDAFISSVQPADQDVLKQQVNGGPNGRRRNVQTAEQQSMQAGQAATAGSPPQAFSAPTTAGEPTAADKFATAQSNAQMGSFSNNLRFFKYLLLIGGLRQQTSSFYRWYIRVTVWGCTLLCLANIFMQTKSFRNPFFDITLVIMHFWVSYSFEKWRVFTQSHHWRLLVSIVSQSKTGNFFVHINQVGVFGLIATAGATIMVCLGWIGPIVYESFVRYQNGGHAYAFMTIHGVFMVLIILPWSAACICSSVLFHMVVLAHQSDVEHYFQTVKSLLITFADSQGSEALEETYGWLVRLLDDFPRLLTLTVRSNTLVVDILSVIFHKTGVPPSVQRLHFGGKELVPHCTLSDYAVGQGSTIQLLLRLPGGGNSLADADRARNLYAYLRRLLSRDGRCCRCEDSATEIVHLDPDTVLDGTNTLAGVRGGRRRQVDFGGVGCRTYSNLLVELERNIAADGTVLLVSLCGHHALQSQLEHRGPSVKRSAKVGHRLALANTVIDRKWEIGVCQSPGPTCAGSSTKRVVSSATVAAFQFAHLHPAVPGGHCAACTADPRLIKYAPVGDINDMRALKWELTAAVTRMLCRECHKVHSHASSASPLLVHQFAPPIRASAAPFFPSSLAALFATPAPESKEAEEASDALDEEADEREEKVVQAEEGEADAVQVCLLSSCKKTLPKVRGRVFCNEACLEEHRANNPADVYAVLWLERVLAGTHKALDLPDRQSAEARALGVAETIGTVAGKPEIPGRGWQAMSALLPPPPPPQPPAMPAPQDADAFQIFISLQQPQSERDVRRVRERWEEYFGMCVRLHQPVRMRLRMTCHYFNSLYALAILVSLMLICASIMDFNDLIVRRNPVWHFIVQDCFFFGLGLVAMYGSLWVTSNLTNYWLRFVQRINELPQFLLTHPAAHNGLVNYFKTADVAYTVYGASVTPAFIQRIIGTAAQIMFVALIIYNWRYFPHQDGSIVLPPPDPPGP